MNGKCANCGAEGEGKFCGSCGGPMIMPEAPSAPSQAQEDIKDIQYKCPNCAAPLAFDSATQKMKCSSCGTEMDMSDFEKYNEALDKAAASKNKGFTAYQGETMPADGLKSSVCQSCAGEIFMDETTVATECPYCGNPTVVPAQVAGILKPDFVIPFKKDKNAAKKALKGFYRSKFLLPKLFKEENRLDKLTGLYVPFWLYDANTGAHGTYNGVRTKSWVSGDYQYTKTDTYLISRSCDLNFEKIPADGSEKMDDTLMEAIEPYEYKDLTPFSMAYLSGYLADKYDVDAEQNKERIYTRIRTSIDDALRRTIRGYQNVHQRSLSVNLYDEKIYYALMPVWMLNTKYNKKMYSFGMNGQTGKLVGDLPIDWKKAAKIGGLVFAGGALVLVLLGITKIATFDTLGSWSWLGILGSIITGFSYIGYLPFMKKMKENKIAKQAAKAGANVDGMNIAKHAGANIAGSVASGLVGNKPIVGNILGDAVRNKIENGGPKK